MTLKEALLAIADGDQNIAYIMKIGAGLGERLASRLSSAIHWTYKTSCCAVYDHHSLRQNAS